jgi:hypothetical protein
MEPWEAGHYLGTGDCGGGERDGEQEAEQQEHPTDHTTKLESNTSTEFPLVLACFPFSMEMFSWPGVEESEKVDTKQGDKRSFQFPFLHVQHMSSSRRRTTNTGQPYPHVDSRFSIYFLLSNPILLINCTPKKWKHQRLSKPPSQFSSIYPVKKTAPVYHPMPLLLRDFPHRVIDRYSPLRFRQQRGHLEQKSARGEETRRHAEAEMEGAL